MKTVEEMRVAVLAECEAVCPDKLHAPIECGHLAFGYVEDDGIRMEAWFLYVGEATAPMSLYALAGEQVWLAAYRLLGLSERDAVEAEKARLLKRYKARIKRLRADDAEIKRLRDFTEKCHKSPEKLVQVVWFADGSFDYCDLVPLQDAAAIALSPAPVTEGPKKTFSLQMYECNRCEWYGQVGESIETESYDVCPKCLSEDLTLLDSPKNEDQE